VRDVRVRLEEAGQHVILKYLKGEATTPTRGLFERGEELFAAALELAPHDDLLLAKELFCRGRALIFLARYPEALDALETSLRLDPTGSYAYNAVGLAYLQQANYASAEGAFLDAIRFAPYWVYPRHNLALTFGERGEFRRAIAGYDQALTLTPRYAYVAYNRALTLQRMNRAGDARAGFRDALSLDPGMARAHTALGLSYALEGDAARAKTEYMRAISILGTSPNVEDELAVRHDMALLLVSTEPDAAIELWNRNLVSRPGDAPSLAGLARTFERTGRHADAIVTYRRLLEVQPGYVGARIALAKLLVADGSLPAADEILTIARRDSPENAAVWELSGDALAADPLRAAEAYHTALRLTTEKQQRTRLHNKLNIRIQGK